MSTDELTHEADGLYYLSSRLLRRRHACCGHRQTWLDAHGDYVVPVTLAILRDHMSRSRRNAGTATFFLAVRMDDAQAITAEEYARLAQASLKEKDNPENSARVVMDVLAARARREGRLS